MQDSTKDLRGEVGGKQKATDPINLASFRNTTNLKNKTFKQVQQ